MIVAGFGFRRDASLESLREALRATGTALPDALAVPRDKAAASVLRQLAEGLRLPVLAIEDAVLAGTGTPTQSAKVLKHRGIGSVAEAAALAGAGAGARLICARVVSGDRMATAAIAVGGGCG